MRIEKLNIEQARQDMLLLASMNLATDGKTPLEFPLVITSLSGDAKQESLPRGGVFETFLARTPHDKVAWITYLKESVPGRIRIYLFAINRSAPAFVMGKGIKEIIRHLVEYRAAHSSYAFSAYATEYSYKIYRRLCPGLFSVEQFLVGYFGGEKHLMDGHFLYSPRGHIGCI